MSKMKRRELEIVRDPVAAADDKRVFCRFNMEELVVRCKDLKSGNKLSGVCEDFSAGGIGLKSETELKPKTPLELWIDFPQGVEPIHLLGKVVWTRLADGVFFRAGVAFDRLRLMSLSPLMKVMAE